MFAVTLSLLSSLTWGLADFAGGLAARRVSALTIVLLGEFIGGGLLAIVLLPGGWHILDYGPQWTVIAAAVGVSGLTLLYWGLARGIMSIIAPIAAAGAVIPVFVTIAEGKAPAFGALIGIALAIVGVVIASIEHGESEKRFGARFSVIVGTVCSLCFGTFLTMIPKAVAASNGHELDIVLDVRIVSVATLTVGWLAVKLWNRTSSASTASSMTRRELLIAFGLIATCGILDTVANSLLAIASDDGNVAVVAVLSSLYPVVTVMLAQSVLRERLSRLQAVGVVTTFVGVLLISGF